MKRSKLAAPGHLSEVARATETVSEAQRSKEALCRICDRAPTSPWRVYNEQGRVELGCVDGCHTGRLVGISGSGRWHLRPEAKKLRRQS